VRSLPIFSFWHSVLNQTDELCRLIRDTPRTVESWNVQKNILMAAVDYDCLEAGFAAFFLNRTNRSGILNGGIIGGREQTGAWKIDARYNAEELIFRVQSIARLRSKINLTKMDAIKFLTAGIKVWPTKTLIYCDPPYYVKGRDLYYHSYEHADHQSIAAVMQEQVSTQRWIVSYDNVPQIRDLYGGSQRVIYGIGYSARNVREGSEVMFFDESLAIPPLTGAVNPIEEHLWSRN